MIKLQEVNDPAGGEISHLANRLKAAGDPLRLEILRLLSQGSYSVLELCRIFALRQPALSHHLKVLIQAELISKRREGNNLFYHRTSDDALVQRLFAHLDQLPLSPERNTRLEKVAAERAEASRRFFANYSNHFRQQQALIASYPNYGPQVAQLLNSGHHALEVGPGEGNFLQELSIRYTSVTALDLSATMITRARQFASEQNLKNIEFICGDTRIAAAQPDTHDCIVLNMVLHHTPDPPQIFRDLVRSLKINGRLLIAELQDHQQDWARDACGDLWLGFSPQQLQYWAQECGFKTGRSIYSALRNGFQIQIHEFIKS